VSGECKEGLAASFGLVFHPPEGLLNRRNTKQVRVSVRKLASGAYASELEPGLFTLGTHAAGSGIPRKL
jgi:hypothetical protein